jgi:C4-dicarboxylate-specific signal transduction histidine kinase
VDLEKACDSALSLVMPSFRHAGIKLARHCPPDLPQVLASHVQVEQIVVNLIRNACEAMTELSDDHPRRLTLSGDNLGDMVKVTVSDTGPGMDEALLSKVFQPLYTTKPDGLGIGLSLCRDLIRSHGGTLDAHQNADGGMDFEFTLPRFTTPE